MRRGDVKRTARVNHSFKPTPLRVAAVSGAGREMIMVHPTYIPDGWPALIPRIAVADPAALVAFVKDVFGAKGSFNAERPTELWIGNSLLMVGSTIDREPTCVFLYVYVEDVDAAFRRAIARGAKPIEEPRDMPYGDRRAMVQDEWGNRWQIAMHRGRFSP